MGDAPRPQQPQNDARGVPPAANVAHLLRQMECDIQSLDKSAKREYNLAMEAIETIVKNETPLLSFLRTEQYDTQKAASRIARYWKHRAELFGDRWLLPMTMTTRGALSVQDVIFLKTGAVFVLPVPNAPPIIFSDAAKAFDLFSQSPQAAEDGTLDRVSMYWATNFTNKLAQSVGCTMFQIVTADKRPRLDYRTQMWDMIHTALPVKINRLVVAQSHAEGKEALLEFLRVQTATISSFNCGLPAQEVHSNSLRRTVLQLENGGFHRAFVPMSLGGSLHFEDAVDKFIRARLSVEDFMGPGLVHGSTATQLELVPYVAPEAVATRRSKRYDEILSQQEVKDRNALYSRRSYHRRKAQLVSLEDQVRSWNDLNEKARAESQRLGMLVKQAMFVVGMIESYEGKQHTTF